MTDAIRPIDYAMRAHAERMKNHMDGIVEALLRERVPGYDLDDLDTRRGLGRLAGRLEVFSFLESTTSPGFIEFVLDGRPLVRFFAPETSMDGGLLTVTQRYQVLP